MKTRLLVLMPPFLLLHFPGNEDRARKIGSALKMFSGMRKKQF
jgi:hypothetical protein